MAIGNRESEWRGGGGPETKTKPGSKAGPTPVE